MENMLDVFRGTGFDLATMTDLINKQPFVPGRIGELNIFSELSMDTTVAHIEEREGALYLVPARPRGAPPTENIKDRRKLRLLEALHLPLHDHIQADEIQGVRAFGQTSVLETIESKVAERLATMKQSFEATHEFHRVGALKGVVYDADGTSVLYNLYDLFEQQALEPVNFAFNADNPGEQDIRAACNLVIRQMQDDMGKMPYQGVWAFVGKDFMDGLSMAPETREAFKRWKEGQEAATKTFVRSTFYYAGIMFEEYRGKVGNIDFIEDGEARFFPIGVPGLFRMAFAPANFIDTVNTPGLPMYAKQKVNDQETGVDLWAQSNPLPYCTRPRLLRQGLAAS